jgi:type III pantothenate kinase
MIALFDIGNTRTKYCFVEHGHKSQSKAVSNKRLSNDFLTEQFSGTTKLLVASVSHTKLTDTINNWCQQNKVVYQRVVSEAKKNHVISAYQEPRKLGVDRWLALIGASEVLPDKNILIIDAGTATTFDLLAANGQHQGGWILAGVNMLITSVLTNTIQVQANKNEQQSIAFGSNTSENVHNAAWATTVGAVNMAIYQSEHLGITIDEIILTGGNSYLLSSLIDQKNVVIEDLVFMGLQTYNEDG